MGDDKNRIPELFHEVDLLKAKVTYMEQAWKENQEIVNDRLNGIHTTVKSIDDHIRNGMSTQITRTASQVKMQWVFIGAGILGMMSMAAGIIAMTLKG